MTDRHLPQPEEPQNGLEHLKSELTGVAERAEALHSYELGQKADDIRAILHHVLPAEVMDSLDQPEASAARIDDLPKGEDGEPIVVSWREARLVIGARPDVAKKAANTVRHLTVIDQQQLKVDMQRAEASGDTAEIARLTMEAHDLTDRIKEIEFFSVVAALHPMSADFKASEIDSNTFDNASYRNLSIYGHLNQVRLLMEIDQVYNRLQFRLRKYNPESVDKMREAAIAQEDKPWIDYASRMDDRVGDAAVDLSKLSHIMNDIVTGRASIGAEPQQPAWRPKVETPLTDAKKEVKKYYDILAQLPGKDLIDEAINGRYETVPQSGWIITSELTPGKDGKMVVYRVIDGGYRLSSSTSAYFRSGRYGEIDVRYNRLDGGVSNPVFWDQIPAGDDTALFVKKESVHTVEDRTGTSWVPIGSTDLKKSYEQWNEFTSDLRVNRITDDVNQAREIVIGLCNAMGMPEADVVSTLRVLEDKDTFTSELNIISAEQARIDKEKILKMMEKPPKVIKEYSNRSRLELHGDDSLWVVESDGSSWMSKSPDGLYYEGPDDLVGYYPE